MSSRSETSQVKLEVSRYTPPELLWLVAVTVILICIGTVNIYSSTQYMNIISGDSTYSHLARHLLFLSISVITAFVLTKLPIKLVRKGALVWVIGTVLLLCLVIVAGKNVNGATRWIQLGPVSLQPSEFAKVTGIIWASSYLAQKVDAGEKIALIPQVFRAIVGIFVSIFLFASGSKRKKNKKYTFGQLLTYISPLAAPLVMAALVMKQPDMGTAAIILLLPCLLYIIAGLPAIEILLGGAGIGTLGLLLALSSAYRRDRLFVLWDPFSDAAGKGYQTVQSLIAVGSGGFLGQGIGKGFAKFLYLPEQYTDFAYAVFCQEMGFIGGIIVMLLFMAFLLLGFATARRLKDSYSAFVVYGLTLMISLQGLINMAMVLGSFPVTGVPLPFISFGGTSLMTNICSVGLIYGTAVQSIENTEREVRKKRIQAMDGVNPFWQ